MALARGKRVALIAAVGAAAILAAFVASQETRLRERWSIWRLGSGDIATRRAAIERLHAVGADASVGPLLEALAVPEVAAEAAGALAAALARSRASTRRAAATALLDRVEESLDPNAARTVTALGSEPGVLDECLTRLRSGEASPSGNGRASAFASILGASLAGAAARGTSASPVLEQIVPRLSATEVARICGETLPLGWGGRRLETPSGDPTALPRAVLAGHADADVRAVALAALALLPPAERPPGVLERAYRTDPDLRSPAVRLAGWIPCGPEQLDLFRILQEEQDPGRLEEAIRARALQTQPLDRADILLLADGLRCPFLGTSPARARAIPLEAAEAGRLEEILATRPEPGVRDAASLALALRHRALAAPAGPDRRGGRDGPRAGALSVHEWTLWEEAPPSPEAAPPPAAGADAGAEPGGAAAGPGIRDEGILPLAVTLAAAGGDAPADEPPEPRLQSRTSVFLRATEPSSVLVEAWLPRGEPAACLPEPTDRRPFDSGEASADGTLAAARRRGGGSLRAQLLAATRAPTGQGNPVAAGAAVPAGTAVRTPYRPPTTSSRVVRAGGVTVRSGATSGLPAARFPAAPWAIATTGRSSDLDSVALEWCGARVGYPAELEGPRAGGEDAPGASDETSAEASDGAAAAATEVAIGGSRYPCLSWEGEVVRDPPVAAAWADASRRAVAVAVRRLVPEPSPPADPRTLYPPPNAEDSAPSGAASTRCPGAFAIRRLEGEEAAGAYVQDLGPEASVTIDLERLPLRGKALESRIVEALASRGLDAEEARGLLELARPSILGEAGTRILAIVPPGAHERALPLRVAPAPRETVRVGVFIERCDDLPVRDERWTRRLDLRPWRPADLEVETRPVSIGWRPCGAPSASPIVREPEGGLVLGGGLAAAALSRDGSVCVATLRDGGRTRVTVLDFARGDVETWIDVPALPPDWPSAGVWASADGRRVALSGRGAEGPATWVLDRGLRQLVRLPGTRAVDLSADGRHVAVLEDDAIVVVDLEAREWRSFRVPAGFRVVGAPSLGGDGARVAFGARATGGPVPDSPGERQRAYVADLAGGLLVRLHGTAEMESPWGAEWSEPRLSADGGTVAARVEGGVDREVVVLDLLDGPGRPVGRLTGTARVQLALDPRRSPARPAARAAGAGVAPVPLALSEDGRRLLVSLEDERRVVDLRDGTMRRVEAGVRRWEARAPCLSADGRRVAVPREGSDGTRLHVDEVDSLDAAREEPAAR